jgi:hypothetical protein
MRKCQRFVPFHHYIADSLSCNLSCKIIAILGPKSEFICPICLVPKCESDNLDGRNCWPIRTIEKTKDLLRRARAENAVSRARDILAEQSLRDIDVMSYPFIHLLG